jgi:hypothetical protein
MIGVLIIKLETAVVNKQVVASDPGSGKSGA